MAGLDPAIHVFTRAKTWMRGSSPRMTNSKMKTRTKNPSPLEGEVGRGVSLTLNPHIWIGNPVTANAASFTASDSVGWAKHMRAISSDDPANSIATTAS